MNIGITMAQSQSSKIWSNGIAQNAINLYFTFKEIKEFNTYLVETNQTEDNIKLTDEIEIRQINNLLDFLDVLIVVGIEMSDYHYNTLKDNGCKIIHYVCGSMYFINMENILFNNNKDAKIYSHVPDEIWIIPQNYETAKYYLESLYKREGILVPFVWSPYFIEKHMKDAPNNEYYYKPSNNKKNISTFEPNINVFKYTLYNIIISELAYNENKDLINHFYITNTDIVRNNKLFVDTMQYYNIVKDGVATFEGRFAMPHFLSNYTDVVIAFQMYNALNYAYLDALYLKYPLVHNADIMKEGGYYYDKFNAEMGKEKLLYALTEHDKHLEEYEESSKKVLDRFMYNNEESVKFYKDAVLRLTKK